MKSWIDAVRTVVNTCQPRKNIDFQEASAVAKFKSLRI